jgi:hypothetical protein
MVADLHITSPKFGTATEPGSVAATLGGFEQNSESMHAEHTVLQEYFVHFRLLISMVFFFLVYKHVKYIFTDNMCLAVSA